MRFRDVTWSVSDNVASGGMLLSGYRESEGVVVVDLFCVKKVGD